jgi:hypothetical protein
MQVVPRAALSPARKGGYLFAPPASATVIVLNYPMLHGVVIAQLQKPHRKVHNEHEVARREPILGISGKIPFWFLFFLPISHLHCTERNAVQVSFTLV